MKTEDIKNIARAWQQVQEKLKGDQHKLDMDKDGDIDAKDFAHMRAKKKKNMDEEEVLVNPKMKDKKKAGAENGEMAAEGVMDKVRDVRKKVFGKTDAEKRAEAERNAMAGFHNAMKKASDGMTKKQKKEEVEQIDELKKSTLGSYAKKASADAASRASDAMDKAKSGDHEGFGKQFTKSRSRLKGAQKAIDKLAKEETTEWPVYARIKENRAAHYKGATAPETMDDKLKGAGAKKMKTDFDGNAADPDFEEKGHDDASKAGRITKKSPARSGADQATGDKSVINKPEDVTKKGQGA